MVSSLSLQNSSSTGSTITNRETYTQDLEGVLHVLYHITLPAIEAILAGSGNRAFQAFFFTVRIFADKVYRILQDLAQGAPLVFGQKGVFASPENICAMERGKAAVQKDGAMLDRHDISMMNPDELAFHMLKPEVTQCDCMSGLV